MRTALLTTSLLLGLFYPLTWPLELPLPLALALKGAPVTLLALWAAAQAEERSGWLLTAALAIGALADVLLELDLTLGGAVFAVGHGVAIWLYLANRRARLAPSQRLLALLVMPLATLAAFLLPADRAAAPGVAVYGLIVAAMAASAWTSRFPRYRTGLGAMLFVASDLLIFARMGPLAGAPWVSFAVWWTYYAAQLLIAVGVSETLARKDYSSPASSSPLSPSGI